MTPVEAEALGGGQAAHMVAALAFPEDVRVDCEDGARLVAQVLGDLVDGVPRRSQVEAA